MSKKKLPQKDAKPGQGVTNHTTYRVGVWGEYSELGAAWIVPQGEERKRAGKREKATRTYPTEEAPNMGKVVDVP